jgi:hypothetical protein
MVKSAIIQWIYRPSSTIIWKKDGDTFSIRCQAQNTGDESCYLTIRLYDNDTSALLYDYDQSYLLPPDGGTFQPFPGTYPVEDLVTMPDHDWNLIAKVWIDNLPTPAHTLTRTLYISDYYTKVGGNDSLSGTTWASAWSTINKAATTAIDGTTVHIGFGTYDAEPATNKIAPQNIGTLGICYLPETATTGGGTGTVSVEQNP